MKDEAEARLEAIQLDGKLVGNGANAGKPGPFGEQMYQWYQDFKNTVMRKG